MLELRNVCKRFPAVTAVDNVSFSVRPGEVTGYLGPNGSGKSTTMKMITGLIGMTSGEILFDGARIHRDPLNYKRRFGYVPEEPHLYSHLSGLEYLVMVGQLRGLPFKRTAERIDGLLQFLGSTAAATLPSQLIPRACARRCSPGGCTAAQPRPHPSGRAVFRSRRGLRARPPKSAEGNGRTRQGGAAELPRTRDG